MVIDIEDRPGSDRAPQRIVLGSSTAEPSNAPPVSVIHYWKDANGDPLALTIELLRVTAVEVRLKVSPLGKNPTEVVLQ